MAAKQISKLSVNLSLTTSQFAKGFKAASRDVQKFTRFMNTDLKRVAGTIFGSFANSLFKAFRGIPGMVQSALSALMRLGTYLAVGFVAAVAAASASLAAMVRNGLKIGDQLSKSADLLKVSTQFLAGLQVAADRAGIAIEAIDRGIARMGMSIAAAVRGSGEAVKAFEAMGLSARELSGMSTEKTFNTIAAAIANISNHSEKLRTIQDIFGRSGIEFIRLFGRNLQGAADDAATLGLAISRVDGAKIEQANDSIARIKMAFQGLTQQLAVEFAPILTFAADKLFAWIKAAGGIPAIVQRALSFAGQKFQDLANIMVATGLAGVRSFNEVRDSIFDMASSGAGRFGDFARSTIHALKAIGSAGMAVFNALKGAVLAPFAFILTAIEGTLKAISAIPGRIGAAARDALATISPIAAQVQKDVASGFSDAWSSAKAFFGNIDDLMDSSLGALGEGIRSEFVDKLTPAVAESFDKIEAALARLNDEGALSGLIESLRRIREQATAAAKDAAGTGLFDNEEMENAADALKEMDAAAKRWTQAMMTPMERIKADLAELSTLFKAGAIDQETYRRGFVSLMNEVTNPEYARALEQQAEQISIAVRTPMEAFRAEVEMLETLLAKQLITAEEFQRAYARLVISMNEFAGSMRASFESAADGLVDSLLAGENAMDSLRKFAAQVVTDMIKEFIRLYVVKAILNAIFGSFGGGSLGFIGNIAAGAMGGSSGGSGSTTREFVADAAASSGNSSRSTTINIDASGSDPAAVERAVQKGIAKAAPAIMDGAVYRVQSRQSRNSAFAVQGA